MQLNDHICSQGETGVHILRCVEVRLYDLEAILVIFLVRLQSSRCIAPVFEIYMNGFDQHSLIQPQNRLIPLYVVCDSTSFTTLRPTAKIEVWNGVGQ
jgi:hypothetical protein